MREEMLKRRAVEDHLRNVQATKWIYSILTVLGIAVLVIFVKPYINKFMVERNPIEQMGTVTYSDRTDKFTVKWNWDGTNYEKTFKGRFVDAKWLVADAGMPVISETNTSSDLMPIDQTLQCSKTNTSVQKRPRCTLI
jgi:hypothetical protein